MGRKSARRQDLPVMVDGKPLNPEQLEWIDGSIKLNSRLNASKPALYRAEADLNGHMLQKTERDWRNVMNLAELGEVKADVERAGFRLGQRIENWPAAFSHEERD